MDYGKYKYEHEKREKDAKKKQHVVVVKEMKIRPKIGIHDLEIKLKHTLEFLDEGNRVRLVITFRGREMANQELGRKILNIALTKLAEKAIVETPPRFEGNNLGCLLGAQARHRQGRETQAGACDGRGSAQAGPRRRPEGPGGLASTEVHGPQFTIHSSIEREDHAKDEDPQWDEEAREDHRHRQGVLQAHGLAPPLEHAQYHREQAPEAQDGTAHQGL